MQTLSDSLVGCESLVAAVTLLPKLFKRIFTLKLFKRIFKSQSGQRQRLFFLRLPKGINHRDVRTIES